jgi:hypothetical protein
MEELKKVSPEERESFKQHYYKMYRAFEKLVSKNDKQKNSPIVRSSENG